MSTTAKKGIAVSYINTKARRPILFEIDVSNIDRGSLFPISQRRRDLAASTLVQVSRGGQFALHGNGAQEGRLFLYYCLSCKVRKHTHTLTHTHTRTQAG